LSGSSVSSLHRLKDDRGEEGGYFVFGDLSISDPGWFRLMFSMFELCSGYAQFLADVYTEMIQAVPAKDFPGRAESSYLSRTFATQGVRLRLRRK
ncbi:hypothetical protein DM02DRAFT_470987, partial [Periconia macrospinosa]